MDAGSSEEPSKLVTKLPVLASARGGDAAVIAGDWLAQLEPSMSSLSPSAASWWRQLMDRVKGLYTTWLECSGGTVVLATVGVESEAASRQTPEGGATSGCLAARKLAGGAQA